VGLGVVGVTSAQKSDFSKKSDFSTWV
jgi:hypothetical protein